MSGELLSVRGLTVEASSAGGHVQAVRNLDLDIGAGDRVGIIGESGSGKTTTVRAIIGLLERNVRMTAGEIRFQGRSVWKPGFDDLASIRGRQVGFVFQSPRASLNPVRTVKSQLQEVLRVHRPGLDGASVEARIAELMQRMGLTDAERVLGSYPHELSCGMCQRVAIAIAVAVEPALIIADECTSALDVTTQADVVRLLRELCVERQRALLFVTHDLLLAAELCSRVVVMYGGEVVEEGAVDAVLSSPRHPYTGALLRAVPPWGPRAALIGIDGAPPKVRPGFRGCGFRERCPHAMEACREDVPLGTLPGGQRYRCLLPAAQPAEAIAAVAGRRP